MKRAKTTKGAATAAHTVDPNGVDAKASTTATAASLLRLGADLSNEEEAQTRKRKQADGSGMENTGASAAPEDGYVVDGVLYPYPQDFWFWLPEGQTAGQLDVLCGRGGESNHSVGNKRFRQIIKDRKEEYRKINPKYRKEKTAFVRETVEYINQTGARFVDVDQFGRYYVVAMEKARKKTSQALRETKELKWLDIDKKRMTKEDSSKNIVCSFCKKIGHKTRIAKACDFHHQWLDAGKLSESSTAVGAGAQASADNSGNEIADALPEGESAPYTKEQIQHEEVGLATSI